VSVFCGNRPLPLLPHRSPNICTGSKRVALNEPIVGMAKSVVGLGPTPSGAGYWFVASDGGIFDFEDASFFGSTEVFLNKPISGCDDDLSLLET